MRPRLAVSTQLRNVAYPGALREANGLGLGAVPARQVGQPHPQSTGLLLDLRRTTLQTNCDQLSEKGDQRLLGVQDAGRWACLIPGQGDIRGVES